MHVISKLLRFQGETKEPKSVMFVGLTKKDLAMVAKDMALVVNFDEWATATEMVVMPVRTQEHLEKLANSYVESKYNAKPAPATEAVNG
jgi:hypothetical protein